MALEMKVYKEIRAFEAHVMFNMSWRQLAASGLGLVISTGAYGASALALHTLGMSWSDATTWAVVVFPLFFVPFLLWGWWRPKGLKPEQYVGYVLRHNLYRKVTPYVDTYHVAQPVPAARPGTQPVPDPGSPAGSARRTGSRAADRPTRQARKAVPQERVSRRRR